MMSVESRLPRYARFSPETAEGKPGRLALADGWDVATGTGSGSPPASARRRGDSPRRAGCARGVRRGRRARALLGAAAGFGLGLARRTTGTRRSRGALGRRCSARSRRAAVVARRAPRAAARAAAWRRSSALVAARRRRARASSRSSATSRRSPLPLLAAARSAARGGERYAGLRTLARATEHAAQARRPDRDRRPDAVDASRTRRAAAARRRSPSSPSTGSYRRAVSTFPSLTPVCLVVDRDRRAPATCTASRTSSGTTASERAARRVRLVVRRRASPPASRRSLRDTIFNLNERPPRGGAR